MRKILYFCLGVTLLLSGPLSWGITDGSLSTTSYMLDVDSIFPTPGRATTDNGIENISDFVINMVPLLTTLMAIGATLMVILGGFHMVIGGTDTEQTEKGKGMLKDALMGLLFGLLAYVIIMTLGNILGI